MLKNFLEENRLEAGCDEAGRGCLAGPVCAAAVIMPNNYYNPLLNDSKKMSEKDRNLLRTEIEQLALSYAVAFVDNHEIDKLNILKASIIGMHRALDQLTIIPDHLLIDGNRFIVYKKIPHTCIVKGDGKFVPIAAASVLAKTYRDELMLAYHKQYGHYAWNRNKGYPTKQHRKALEIYGPTEYHRKTFRLTNIQTEIIFEDPFKTPHAINIH